MSLLVREVQTSLRDMAHGNKSDGSKTVVEITMGFASSCLSVSFVTADDLAG